MSSNVVALKAVGEPTTIDGVVTTPGWLLSDPEDHVWTVADGPSYDFDQPRTASIDFRHHLPDGTRLTDPSNEEWLALARQYAVLLREHETSRIDTAQMQAAQVRELFKLMDFMRLQAEPIERFEHLRQADIARYVLVARHGLASILDVAERAAGLAQAGVDISDARTVREHLHLPPQLSISAELEVASGRSNGEPNMLTHNPLFRTLLVPEQLWDFRREIEGDNLRFHPFETSASAEAAKHCSDTCRTPVIPQRQAMMLIDGCLRLFVELGPIVLSCRSVMEDEFAKATNRPSRRAALARLAAVQAEGIGKLSERLRLPKGRSPLDVIEQATVVLVQACFVLIAALSARRAAEIETLQEDCITGGDGSRFVYSAILKTERENQHTPVPDVVARLVDWMHEIGTPARLASGSQRLFIWSDARSLATRSRARTNVPKDFDRLAQLCDVPPHEGMAWRFSARQFRRFFAIVYMWRYENPDLGALRLHLRHWDFRQTRGYCTDGTLGRIFTEEQRGFTRTVVGEALAGVRQVGGAAGGRLVAMAARLKPRFSGVVAMEPERLADWSKRIADRMVVRCNPWSYCTCPDTRRGAKDANCRPNPGLAAVGPDLSHATLETCIGCRHRMTDPVFAPFMRTEVELGTRMLASPRVAGTPLAAATQKRLDVIRDHVATADAAGTPP